MYGDILLLFLMTISNSKTIPPELVTDEENFVPSNCDRTINTNLKVGDLGETSIFPWMGVLRVHIVEGKNISIAITQIILVKSAFAIAHAHDTAKLHVGLRVQSKAMFIPSDNTQWFTIVKEVRVHPEYSIYTFSTLSVIKLDWTFDDGPIRLPPACWPFNAFNSNGELYAVGFTDENQLLEKIFFKLLYSDRKICDEFYKRLLVDDVSDLREKPSDYHCAFALEAPKNCVWENGMAMVSNASGHWILLGLSVSGPNCTFPGRFIDINQYTAWIDSFTTLQDDGPFPMIDTLNNQFYIGR